MFWAGPGGPRTLRRLGPLGDIFLSGNLGTRPPSLALIRHYADVLSATFSRNPVNVDGASQEDTDIPFLHPRSVVLLGIRGPERASERV